MKKTCSIIVVWILACCFYSTEKTISIFLFGFFFSVCLVNNINKYKVLFITLVGFFYLFYVLYINKISNFDFLYNWINDVLGFNLRETISLYFVNTHGETIGSFLSLILLNIKNHSNNSIYYKLINLSIVHLIVIGGYHINLLCYCFAKLFYKWPTFGKVINLIISFLIAYLNGFSVSCIRFFSANIFNLFRKMQSYRNNLSLILIGFIAPQTLVSISFCMSYLGSRGIGAFTKLHGQGKLYNDLFSSMFATIYIIPFIAVMNDSISLWGIFLTLLFSPLFMVLYFMSFFFAWFNCFDILFNFFYQIIYETSNKLTYINVLIPIGFLNNQLFFITYYLTLETLNFLILERRNIAKWKLKKFERIF